LLFFDRSYQVLLTDVIIPRWAIQAPGSLLFVIYKAGHESNIGRELDRCLDINVNDSQNVAFATSHFVIELLPFDYLIIQK
jgi:hypothetical protein